LKSLKFSCPSELREWLEDKAVAEQRTVSSMIRVMLYEAKYAEEARQLEASA
jgi:uncharacterized protein YeaC (DUF1315 family)